MSTSFDIHHPAPSAPASAVADPMPSTAAPPTVLPPQPVTESAPRDPNGQAIAVPEDIVRAEAGGAGHPGPAAPKASDDAPNVRERQGGLSPTDQGRSSAETKITAAVRRALVGSNSLGFGAKNAKVITIGSKVTLRGSVKSEAEKAEIESLTRSVEGVTEVDNQLEVKP